MPHPYLPQPVDVVSALANMQPVAIALPAGFDVSSQLAAAVDSWNRRTGYRPFFQTSTTPVAVLVDPPGPDRAANWGGGSGLLFLPNGLLGLTSLVTQYDPTTTPVGGDTLTINQDFWLCPGLAPTQVPPEPWTSIKFGRPQRGTPQSIQITGVWGYCQNQVPDDAWLAILNMGVANCLQELVAAIATGPTNFKMLDDAISYDAAMLKGIGGGLTRQYERVLMRYRLLSF